MNGYFCSPKRLFQSEDFIVMKGYPSGLAYLETSGTIILRRDLVFWREKNMNKSRKQHTLKYGCRASLT